MATDATGTPTTNYSIPTYNTAVDNPSGDGFNAAMVAIDTALDDVATAAVAAPSGIASGEGMIWNGSAWARSSVTRLATVRPQDLTQDAANPGDVMTWNGSIWAPAASAASGPEVLSSVTTPVQVINTATEGSLFTYSVPANTLNTTEIIHVKMIGDILFNGAGTETSSIKMKWGGTTIIDITSNIIGTNATRRLWFGDFFLAAAGSTSSQHLAYTINFTTATAAITTGIGQSGDGNAARWFQGQQASDPAKDATSSQTLDITYKWSAAHASCGFRMNAAWATLY